MKRLIIGLFVLMSTTLLAQTAETYLELLRSDVKMQKKTVIAAAMELNKEQSEKFWPIYREEKKRRTKDYGREEDNFFRHSTQRHADFGQLCGSH